MNRHWKAIPRIGYWVVEQQDPEGSDSDSIGPALVINDKKIHAERVADALNAAYWAGREDEAKAEERLRLAIESRVNPHLDVELYGLPPGQYTVENRDGVLRLVESPERNTPGGDEDQIDPITAAVDAVRAAGYEVGREQAHQIRLAVRAALPRCDPCGEPIKTDRQGNYAEEVGEFWDEERQDSVLAHAQCGVDRGWDLA